jgi:BlaI family transcriptional regulator, penicillinase repressor
MTMRKPGTPRDIPPPLELECLKALWRLGEGNVKEVQRVLCEKRNLAYTTVMTVLDRLVRKGAVSRSKQGRAFIYTPVLSRESLRRAAIEELLESFFDGSRRELLSYLRSGPPSSVPAGAPEPEPRLETVLL